MHVNESITVKQLNSHIDESETLFPRNKLPLEKMNDRRCI